jgi:pimeloyl-[acyl-carrier protein] methyl ester esterase
LKCADNSSTTDFNEKGEEGRGKGKTGTSPFSLDSIVAQLSARFNEPLNLCGWSLGGIIAQHWAAREPEKVQRLILVSSTPCFAARADWAYGMPQETLAQFAAELEKNHAATLRRFLALQVRGSEGERELLVALREKLFSRGEPHLDALRGGLAILRDADLRSVLPQITQPTLVIAGERDKLTPPEASHYLAQSLPHARAVVVAGAAHAPFLSHPEIFIEQVKSFLHE